MRWVIRAEQIRSTSERVTMEHRIEFQARNTSATDVIGDVIQFMGHRTFVLSDPQASQWRWSAYAEGKRFG